MGFKVKAGREPSEQMQNRVSEIINVPSDVNPGVKYKRIRRA